MSNASGDMRRVLEACEAALDELVYAVEAEAEAAAAAMAAPSESSAAQKAPAAAADEDDVWQLDASAATVPPREQSSLYLNPSRIMRSKLPSDLQSEEFHAV